MPSPLNKQLTRINRNCGTVHAYLVKLAMRTDKTKPLRKDLERALTKVIAAMTEARDMLRDLVEEREDN